VIGTCRNGDASRFRHLLNSSERLEGAKQNSSSFSVRKTTYVEAVVVAVDEVDVRNPRRAKQDSIAGGSSAGGMSGGIIQAEIGLDFHDPRGQALFAFAAQEYLAQQVAADGSRIARVEVAWKR